LREIVGSSVSEHQGHLVKDTGEQILAEFSSVVDAVRCAADIQHDMTGRNADLPENERILYRIGINAGDVIEEPEDIYGDGVNIATRLETLAEPGGICVSEIVYEQVRNRLPYHFDDKGEQPVKNIARPLRVFTLQPGATASLPILRVPPVPCSAHRTNSAIHRRPALQQPEQRSGPAILCGRNYGRPDHRVVTHRGDARHFPEYRFYIPRAVD